VPATAIITTSTISALPTNTSQPAPTATPAPTNTGRPVPTTTPSPTNTSQPLLTATPLPSYSANFDKNAHGWDVGIANYIAPGSDTPDQTVDRFISEGEYRVTLTSKEGGAYVWALQPRYEKVLGPVDELHNFALELDVKIITGSNTTESIGVYFRSIPLNGYATFISPPSGTAEVYIVTDKKGEWWINHKPLESIDRSKFNRLRIEAIDSQIRVFINGELLIEKTDATYSKGGIRIGLWVPAGTSTTYAIDNFKIWKLD
jgi:Domain of Unknown Function (DUF1080)